jgi:hypothetical protein
MAGPVQPSHLCRSATPDPLAGDIYLSSRGVGAGRQPSLALPIKALASCTWRAVNPPLVWHQLVSSWLRPSPPGLYLVFTFGSHPGAPGGPGDSYTHLPREVGPNYLATNQKIFGCHQEGVAFCLNSTLNERKLSKALYTVAGPAGQPKTGRRPSIYQPKREKEGSLKIIDIHTSEDYMYVYQEKRKGRLFRGLWLSGKTPVIQRINAQIASLRADKKTWHATSFSAIRAMEPNTPLTLRIFTADGKLFLAETVTAAEALALRGHLTKLRAPKKRRGPAAASVIIEDIDAPRFEAHFGQSIHSLELEVGDIFTVGGLVSLFNSLAKAAPEDRPAHGKTTYNYNIYRGLSAARKLGKPANFYGLKVSSFTVS